MNRRVIGGVDLSDPGTWPMELQGLAWLLTFAAVLVLAWHLMLSEPTMRWWAQQQRAAESQTPTADDSAPQPEEDLQALLARKTALEREGDRLDDDPWPPWDAEDLLRAVATASRARGLQLVWFRPAPSSPGAHPADGSVAWRLVGSFHDLGTFWEDFIRMPHPLTLRQLTLAPPGPSKPGEDALSMDSPGLVMEATLGPPAAPLSESTLRMGGRQPVAHRAPPPYQGRAHRDPFAAMRRDPAAQTAASPADQTGFAEAPLLERTPLESIVFVGTLERGTQRLALLQLQGQLHPVGAGQRLGPKGGVIEQIQERSFTVSGPLRRDRASASEPVVVELKEALP
ncbi:MAG: hypothetical protein RIR43_1716 [Pseudomonadota bacterium]